MCCIVVCVFVAWSVNPSPSRSHWYPSIVFWFMLVVVHVSLMGVGVIAFWLEAVKVTTGFWFCGNVMVSSVVVVVFNAYAMGRDNGPDVTIRIVIINPMICLVFTFTHTQLFKLDNSNSKICYLLFKINHGLDSRV